jgi:hypothetical protein
MVGLCQITETNKMLDYPNPYGSQHIGSHPLHVRPLYLAGLPSKKAQRPIFQFCQLTK